MGLTVQNGRPQPDFHNSRFVRRNGCDGLERQKRNYRVLRRGLQKFLQLAAALGRSKLVEAAHVGAIDEDLRHGARARRAVQHLGARRGIDVDPPLAPFESLGLQKVLGGHAVTADRGGIDFDIGHDAQRYRQSHYFTPLEHAGTENGCRFPPDLPFPFTREPNAIRQVQSRHVDPMSMSKRFRPLLTLAATLALSLPALAQQADVRLPSLGSSADAVMSPQEAQAYGAEFMRELRAAHLVMDDPQVDQYLRTLGYRLASASSDPAQQYTFTALNVPEINAFATFGGYVFIFSGMFTLTQNQDQLAAVMAHELAHVSQRHLQRAIEDQKKTAPLYVLGVFAAALAASQVDSTDRRVQTQPYGYGYGNAPYSQGMDPSVGAFYSVLAMMQQHQIDFTRKDEAEADHVGIDTLAKAGFDPIGMATVFAHMQSVLRPGGDGGMAA